MLLNWILVSLTAALSTGPTPELAPTLDWKENYSLAVEECREEKRPLLVVWDIPSDKSQAIASELLSNCSELKDYELCHIDASTEYGKQLADGFRVKSFPHAAIIDRTGGTVLTRMEGPITEATWKSTLDQYKEGVSKSFSGVYNVAKPIVNSSSISTSPAPIYSFPSQSTSTARPYCPSCQLRN